MNKSDLLAQIRASHAQIESELDHRPDAKDLLAHLSFWEQRAAEIFESLLSGSVPPSTIDESDVDSVNQGLRSES